MLSPNDIKEIHYFKDVISVEQIKRGYKKRKKYKITTKNGQNYFIKTHHRRLNKKEIIKGKILYETYQSLKLPVVPLLDIVTYKNKTMFIYPFFEGICLKDSDYTLKEYYEYGKKVGQDIIKLQKKSWNPEVFHRLNLDDYFQEDKLKIKKIWETVNDSEKILQIFSRKDLEKLSVLYRSLLDFMKKQKYCFNHNDIKMANIMLDAKSNYYFVDIDPMDLTPPGFNVYYSMYVFLLHTFQEKEKAFLRGFIQTIDPNKKIIKQLQYFLIADMINECQKLLEDYFDDLQKNKKYIKEILFNKNDLLEKIIYDKSYG